MGTITAIITMMVADNTEFTLVIGPFHDDSEEDMRRKHYITHNLPRWAEEKNGELKSPKDSILLDNPICNLTLKNAWLFEEEMKKVLGDK